MASSQDRRRDGVSAESLGGDREKSTASTPDARDATDVRPFANGAEGYDWCAANCDRCGKNSPPDEFGIGGCEMETAIALGFISGTVPAALAVEYGATLCKQPGYCRMPRQCSRFVPLALCESIATRNGRKCGRPATKIVEHDRRTFPVCARHRRAYLASLPKPV